jgi:hypothetical protein
VTPENEAAYAKLLRDSVSPDKVGGLLADKADNLAMQGGYERVDGFIASVNATDGEREAIVARAMNRKLITSLRGSNGINVEELDKARAWGATQAPGSVDAVTGQALAKAVVSGGDFKEATDLVLQYNLRSGGDAVLAAFLKNSHLQGDAAKQAGTLVEQIKDPALRAEILALPQYRVNRPEL